jgi:hypothetical protein
MSIAGKSPAASKILKNAISWDELKDIAPEEQNLIRINLAPGMRDTPKLTHWY